MEGGGSPGTRPHGPKPGDAAGLDALGALRGADWDRGSDGTVLKRLRVLF